MALREQHRFQGGTLVVTDIQPTGEGKLSQHDDELIGQYIRFLNEKKIIGDIEVSILDVMKRFDGCREVHKNIKEGE